VLALQRIACPDKIITCLLHTLALSGLKKTRDPARHGKQEEHDGHTDKGADEDKKLLADLVERTYLYTSSREKLSDTLEFING
jgi:hypothetical protein